MLEATFRMSITKIIETHSTAPKRHQASYDDKLYKQVLKLKIYIQKVHVRFLYDRLFLSWLCDVVTSIM